MKIKKINVPMKMKMIINYNKISRNKIENKIK